MLILLIKFIIASILIVWSGVKLSKLGDIISEKTGISRGWIGLILLAVITSLPELVTSLGAVLKENAPNLTLGNVWGSNMFNIFILCILDVFYHSGPLLGHTFHSHILSGALGCILMSIAGLGIYLNLPGLSIMNVGLDSLLILVVYLLGIRLIFYYEKRYATDRPESTDWESPEDKKEMRKYYLQFIAWAIVIVFTGIWLAGIGKDLADLKIRMSGRSFQLGTTFVGSIFIAVVTSLPELVISLGAIYLGSVDMAVGNILGSNIFNLTIIGISDIAYRKGPILSLEAGKTGGVTISQTHLVSAFAALLMANVTLLALGQRERRGITALKLGWYSPVIFIVYVCSTYLLFKIGVTVG